MSPHITELEPIEYTLVPEKKLAYLVISKSGCTSIKATLARYYGIDEPSLSVHEGTFHKEHTVYGELTGTAESYFTFTFVRNPLARLVSCYKERIQASLPPPYKPDYFAAYYPYAKTYGLCMGLSFTEFADRVVQISDDQADRHFKTQSSTIYRTDGSCRVDFIGHLETIATDWPPLAKRFDLAENMIKANRATRTLRKDDYREYYTQALLEKVYAYYQKDFVHLGYTESFNDLIS